jgi:hypothetical protein
VVAILTALALAGISVPPPPAAGPWRQLGAAVASRPGKQLHFFRTATSPANLGVVVTSRSARPIHLAWFTYCEFESDDANFEEHNQTVTGVHTVVAYPPVLSGATLCYVSVNAGAGRGAAVSAAVFSN